MPNLHNSGHEGLDELLGAARQGATPDELMHMESTLDQFTAVVASGVRAADDTIPEPVLSPRSTVTMFNTRIPRRAAAIVVATMFAAGTAAAAAGGVLPTPFTASADPVLVDDTSVDDTGLDTDSTLEGITDDTGVDGTEVDDDSADDSASDDHSLSERDFGNCEAWLNGADNDPASPAFAHLADEAAEEGVTIDEYCTTLVDEHRSGHGSDDADDAGDDHGGSMPTLPEQSRGDDHATTPSLPDDRGGSSGRSGGSNSGSGSSSNSGSSNRGGGDDTSGDD